MCAPKSLSRCRIRVISKLEMRRLREAESAIRSRTKKKWPETASNNALCTGRSWAFTRAPRMPPKTNPHNPVATGRAAQVARVPIRVLKAWVCRPRENSAVCTARCIVHGERVNPRACALAFYFTLSS
eukprot:5262603-Pleurochrysis_carterae.AAC.3